MAELKTISKETHREALEKWKQYRAAEKMATGYYKQKRPLYRDLKKLYFHMKSGAKIINLFEILKTVGVHEDNRRRGHPKMAVALINTKEVYCRFNVFTGAVQYRNEQWTDKVCDVSYTGVYRTFENITLNGETRPVKSWDRIELKTVVPLVPPQYLPKQITDDLYILWEVEHWDEVPTDPWLLKRITKDHFILLEGWDLTELERSVMAAHQHS